MNVTARKTKPWVELEWDCQLQKGICLQMLVDKDKIIEPFRI
jgi:hypothetical protein